MSETQETSSRTSSFFVIVLVLQFALCTSVLLDIAVARQVIGFLYLTFIPGFLIVNLLKMNKLGKTETVLFSVGLSVALLMLVGLLLNTLAPLIGIQRPLDTAPVTISLSVFVLAGAAVDFWRNKGDKRSSGGNWISLRLLVLLILPVLSVLGAVLANITGSTSILLFAILGVAAVFVIAVFFKRLLPARLHTAIVFVIAATLLFHFSLVSSYLYGFADIQIEYSMFRLTQVDGYWNSTAYFIDPVYGTYNDMLSITVLPTIYSNVLDMDATQILRVVFPLIFAFVPVALYLMWREKVGAKLALFSAFLLMSQVTFYTEMVNLARQMVAELFFVLLFIVIFSKRLNPMKQKILFIIFGFSLVVSHYSMAIVFLFLISVTWLATYYAKRTSRNLTVFMIALFFALMFGWYIYTSASTSFGTILAFVNSIYSGLGSFFNPASRGEGVLGGLGMGQVQSSLQVVSRAVAYATELFIAMGFLVLLLQRRKKKNVDFEYFILCSASMIILALCILLPNFALSLQITRFYHILLFFLAPLFSIGCIACVGFVTRKKMKKSYSSAFIAVLLLVYFLFQTNFLYEVAGAESWSVPLSRYRLGPRLYTEFAYITGSEVRGAEWLSQHASTTDLVVHADASAFPTLMSYGAVYREKLRPLTNITSTGDGEFVYLGDLNTVYGIVLGIEENDVWNMSEITGSQLLSSTYTNGYCEIYKNTAAPP